MNQSTAPTPNATTLAARFLAAAALLVLAAGCTTVYVPRYADQGVYYDDPYYNDSYDRHPAASSSYGYDRAWAVNPVHYPYWSLDYFYFSQYYHPYSVVVGSWDPYYYPYPGWRYAPRPRHGYHGGGGFGVSIAFGDPWYGYPWHGYGWGYRPVHYGYFGSAWYGHGYGHGYAHGYGHGRYDDHPVHRNNDRMRALQRRESAASRNVLVSQRTGRLNGARYVPDRAYQGRAPSSRFADKRGDLRSGQGPGRAAAASRIERRAGTPDRAGAVRSSNRATLQSRPRFESRAEPRRIERQRIEPPRRGVVRERSGQRLAPVPRYESSRPAGRGMQPGTRSEIRSERSATKPPATAPTRRTLREAPRVRIAPAPSSNRASRPMRSAPPRAPTRAAPPPRPAVRAAPPRPASRAQSRGPSRSAARVERRASSGGRDRLRSRRDSGGNRDR